MYQINVILVLVSVHYSSAILSSLENVKPLNNDRRLLNKSDIHPKIKREGIYPYYYRPHFMSHTPHPDTEYHSLYEVNGENENHGYIQHPTPVDNHYEHDKDLAMKALFAPLFGIALLGVVAAMINNPVLLQLGVLSGKRRRKRREAIMKDDLSPVMVPPAVIDRLHNDLMMIGHILSQMPRANLRNEERRLVDNYLTCSELGRSLKANENCFKRLVCELWSEKSNINMITPQKAFIKTILAELINNEYTQNKIRRNVKDAQRFGQENGNCEIYVCNVINNSVT